VPLSPVSRVPANVDGDIKGRPESVSVDLTAIFDVKSTHATRGVQPP
jgi:hypothetical protein